MPYDDIRFSGWDDPDDDDDDDDETLSEWMLDALYRDDDDIEFMMEYECRTCGKEVTYIDEKGDCSWCRMVNNS